MTLFIVLISQLASLAGTGGSVAETAAEQAASLYAIGDLDSAILALKDGLESAADEPQLHFMLANALYRKEDCSCTNNPICNKTGECDYIPPGPPSCAPLPECPHSGLTAPSTPSDADGGLEDVSARLPVGWNVLRSSEGTTVGSAEAGSVTESASQKESESTDK